VMQPIVNLFISSRRGNADLVEICDEKAEKVRIMAVELTGRYLPFALCRFLIIKYCI
jgi:hypothetical protein